MSVGFLVFIQTLMFLSFGFDFRNHGSEAAAATLSGKSLLQQTSPLTPSADGET